MSDLDKLNTAKILANIIEDAADEKGFIPGETTKQLSKEFGEVAEQDRAEVFVMLKTLLIQRGVPEGWLLQAAA